MRWKISSHWTLSVTFLQSNSNDLSIIQYNIHVLRPKHHESINNSICKNSSFTYSILIMVMLVAIYFCSIFIWARIQTETSSNRYVVFSLVVLSRCLSMAYYFMVLFHLFIFWQASEPYRCAYKRIRHVHSNALGDETLHDIYWINYKYQTFPY